MIIDENSRIYLYTLPVKKDEPEKKWKCLLKTVNSYNKIKEEEVIFDNEKLANSCFNFAIIILKILGFEGVTGMISRINSQGGITTQLFKPKT